MRSILDLHEFYERVKKEDEDRNGSEEIWAKENPLHIEFIWSLVSVGCCCDDK